MGMEILAFCKHRQWATVHDDQLLPRIHLPWNDHGFPHQTDVELSLRKTQKLHTNVLRTSAFIPPLRISNSQNHLLDLQTMSNKASQLVAMLHVLAISVKHTQPCLDIYIYDYINMLYVYGGGTISRCPDRQQADRMLWKLWYTRNVRPGDTPAGKHIRSHLHWRIASRIVHHALDCRYRLTKTPYSSHSIHDYISKSEYLLFKIKNKTSVGQLLLIAQKLWYLND